PNDLRRAIERLSGLPLRPTTARTSLDGPDVEARATPPCAELDPGWALARLRGVADPLDIVADNPWWKPPGTHADAIGRLWRNSVAVSLAARRLAREANRPDANEIARAGLLHRAGL